MPFSSKSPLMIRIFKDNFIRFVKKAIYNLYTNNCVIASQKTNWQILVETYFKAFSTTKYIRWSVILAELWF